MSQDERLSVYNSSGQMFKSTIEKNITKLCTDKFVTKYAKKIKIQEIFYECSKLSVFGTEYKHGQYIILPDSTNASPLFGKIYKLLTCGKKCYLYYQLTSAIYCSKTDLFMITEEQKFDILPSFQLPDYHIIEPYAVGEGKKTSLSMRNNILENILV